MILSTGPPELQASTGLPANIASSGTIPKCSFSGVYNTQVQLASSSPFSCELTDGKNVTSLDIPSSTASLKRIVFASSEANVGQQFSRTLELFSTSLHRQVRKFSHLLSSLKWSTFSFSRTSYPPAITNRDWGLPVAAVFFRYTAYALRARFRFFFLSKRLIERNMISLFASTCASSRPKLWDGTFVFTAGYMTRGCFPLRYRVANVLANVSAVNWLFTITRCACKAETRTTEGQARSNQSGALR